MRIVHLPWPRRSRPRKGASAVSVMASGISWGATMPIALSAAGTYAARRTTAAPPLRDSAGPTRGADRVSIGAGRSGGLAEVGASLDPTARASGALATADAALTAIGGV